MNISFAISLTLEEIGVVLKLLLFGDSIPD